VLGVSGSLAHLLAVKVHQSEWCAGRGTPGPAMVDCRTVCASRSRPLLTAWLACQERRVINHRCLTIDVTGGESGFVLPSDDTWPVKDSLPPQVSVCPPLRTPAPDGRLDCAPPWTRAVVQFRRASSILALKQGPSSVCADNHGGSNDVVTVCLITAALRTPSLTGRGASMGGP